MLGLYGGKDQGIPLDTVDKMKAALATGTPAAQGLAVRRLPRRAATPSMPTTGPAIVKAPAEDGWQRALAWFKANGVA